MARIRTLKPSFWSDPAVVRMSRDARLLILGLISNADDDGRMKAALPVIQGAVFPDDRDVTPAKIQRWLDEAVDSGMVHIYTSDGIPYLCLPKWHRHQVINKYTPSALPAPDIECVSRKGRP